jgi:hypothetical protein
VWIILGGIAVVTALATFALLFLPAEAVDGLRTEFGLSVGLDERHVIPSDRRGWLVVQFGVAGAPALERDGGRLVFHHPESGALVTSSPWNPGLKTREFRQGDGEGAVSLPKYGPDARIWGEADITVREHKDEDATERRCGFFVGTEEEYLQAGSLTRSPSYLELQAPRPAPETPGDPPSAP